MQRRSASSTCTKSVKPLTVQQIAGTYRLVQVNGKRYAKVVNVKLSPSSSAAGNEMVFAAYATESILGGLTLTDNVLKGTVTSVTNRRGVLDYDVETLLYQFPLGVNVVKRGSNLELQRGTSKLLLAAV